jgi:hypothetical protein
MFATGKTSQMNVKFHGARSDEATRHFFAAIGIITDYMYNAEAGDEVAVTDPLGVQVDTAARRPVSLPRQIIERARVHAAS